MKLRCIVLAALVTVVAADYLENNGYYEQPAAPSQYYGYQRRRSAGGGLAGFVRRLFGRGDVRRQFTGTGATGGGGVLGADSLGSILLPIVLVGLGGAALVAAIGSLDLNNSGRGLDTDEWEVDHSVWMNQLQKDFEDSWSTE
ncbi:uncharacterized protein LOC122375595 [Amphibalanus amphitrite]|uniref:uncharacterized protein LOC122375595 n=1 Tax=Amphibalanus amphitrite TaxID=1232801 RepID=UPI001C91D53D|nr:uncharacterized protein LOC122375595 [Amphibalanus amphitrite]XP_043211033.1 uncharacterized protein LOC122375595 [Amphibalanus amphitrite]